MLDGINDTDEHARELVKLVKHGPNPVSCKLNLIPFNSIAMPGLKRSTDARVQSFAKILLDAGIVTTVRKARGEDIEAACGLLAGEIKDRTRIQERMAENKVDPKAIIENYRFQNNC